MLLLCISKCSKVKFTLTFFLGMHYL